MENYYITVSGTSGATINPSIDISGLLSTGSSFVTYVQYYGSPFKEEKPKKKWCECCKMAPIKDLFNC